jgi:ABC-type Fe3+ transport system substrate-binding protein
MIKDKNKAYFKTFIKISLFLFPLLIAAQDINLIEKISIYKGMDRQEIIVSGARKEGAVTLYTGMIVDQAVRPIVAGFQKKYPFIKIQYVREDPSPMAQKLISEARANKVMADVIENMGIEVQLKAGDVIRPFWSPELAEYGEEFKKPSVYVAAFRNNYFGLAYNTNQVSSTEVPKTYNDLLNPKWKGKMVWSNSITGWALFSTHIRKIMGESKGTSYLQELSKQDIALMSSSPRTVVDRVISGDYAIAINIFIHHPVLSARKGAPIASKLLDPVPSMLGTLMLPKNPRHPHAAMLLIDYLLSKEGQSILKDAEYFPCRLDVNPITDLETLVPSKVGYKENYVSQELANSDYPAAQEIFKKYFQK